LGGAQEWCGVQPDVSAFGKVIGGGMPVGAIGGPASVMDRMAPLGNVYQAGTLSGNPIAMAAGLATLELISEPGFFERLSARCGALIDGLNEAARAAGVAFTAHHIGGMAGMVFSAHAPTSYADVLAQDTTRFKAFFHAMLDRGVYFPPSAVEAFFFSSAHGDAEIAYTLEQAKAAFQSLH
jgi:glutamate-1-semialdehyde 2,1-aminomutase